MTIPMKDVDATEVIAEGELAGTEAEIPAYKSLSRGRLIWRRLKGSVQFWIGISVLGLIVLWAVFGPMIWPISALDRDYSALNQGPSLAHPFGTDTLGYDLLARVTKGLQISLIVGFVAGPLATLIAAVIGAFAGYVGGWPDKVISWLIDLLLVLPSFLILVVLSPYFKTNSWLVMLFFLAIFGWMIMGQVVRNQTRSLRERDFVKAARYMGFGPWAVVRRHIIPNIASLLIIDATLGVGAMILAETTLSFFGFGVQHPDISLGTLISQGNTSATTRPYLFFYPAGTLVILLLSLSLVGDAVRDAVDPTSETTRA